MNSENGDRVFICYAKGDLERVRNVVHGLRERKVDLWFDKEKLQPGTWKPQIVTAINHSRYFLMCLSQLALQKIGEERGFQDEEQEAAYEIALAQSGEAFTIVPVRLEECGRGDFRVGSFQQYDLFPDLEEGLDRLAVHLGGLSKADPGVRDERTEKEKTLEGLRGKAAAAHFAGDFEVAISVLDDVLAIASNDSLATQNKGAALGMLGRHEEALAAFDKALELNPDSWQAWQNKGAALGMLGRHEEALVAFDKALELNPDSWQAWKNKSATFGLLDRHEEALEASDKALELSPDSWQAWQNKSAALSKLGRYEEAIVASDKALELKQKNE